MGLHYFPQIFVGQTKKLNAGCVVVGIVVAGVFDVVFILLDVGIIVFVSVFVFISKFGKSISSPQLVLCAPILQQQPPGFHFRFGFGSSLDNSGDLGVIGRLLLLIRSSGSRSSISTCFGSQNGIIPVY